VSYLSGIDPHATSVIHFPIPAITWLGWCVCLYAIQLQATCDPLGSLTAMTRLIILTLK